MSLTEIASEAPSPLSTGGPITSFARHDARPKITTAAEPISAAEVIQRLPRNLRLCVPTAKRTLLRSVRLWGSPLYESYCQLLTALTGCAGQARCADWYRQNYSFFKGVEQIEDGTAHRLYSAALLLNWIAGRATASLGSDACLSEAEAWSHGPVSTSPCGN